MNNKARNIASLLLLVLLPGLYSLAQVTFRTIVTQGPVVAGESFQVQYVIEELDKNDDFFPPDFRDFRFVSGPNIYEGSALGIDGPKKLKNIVYTLAAVKPGKFIIPGASARLGDKLIKSENAWLQVISKTDLLKKARLPIQESNEDYFLGPDEDPYQKMKRNLFMKVLVDKRTCFVGEPVTATFKLYSRLESRSDIVKNPGFYGFTVQDVVNLNDNLSATENINGKNFDVHVVRKVQLYPLQAGIFNIDAMEVRNKVEFSKSAVSKKTEQEIVEGVFSENNADEKANTVVFENNMNTEAVAITVKHTPQKNKPVDYNGAAGIFNIAARLEKAKLDKNEESTLIITINGKGNFTQLEAPIVKWPAGIEGFEPTVKDSLSAEHSPLSGKREFRFRFVSAKPGNYVLPAISFSFFKLDSNNYKTVSTESLNVIVTNKENPAKEVIQTETGAAKNNGRWKWVLIGLTALAVTLASVYVLKRRREIIKPDVVTSTIGPVISVESILQPAYTFSEADNKTYYTVLRTCIWDFFNQHFGLTGSKMSKSNLVEIMNEKGIDDKGKKAVLDILNDCETGLFTNAEDAIDKKKLLEETKEVLKSINDQLQ